MSTGNESNISGLDNATIALARSTAAGLARFGVVADESRKFTIAEQSVEQSFTEPAAFAYDHELLREPADDKGNVITNSDIESLMASITQRFPSLPPETLAEIKAGLISNVGASKTNFSEIVSQAMNQARVASDGMSTSQQQPLSLQEQLQQMMQAYRESSQAARDEFRERGYGDTPENEEKLKKLWAKLEHLEVGSPEWIKTYNQITTMDANYFEHVKEEALKHGDTKTAEKAQAALDVTHKAQDDLKSTNLENSNQRAIEEKDTSYKKTFVNFDEEEPSTAQTKPAAKNETLAAVESKLSEPIELGNLTPPPVGKPTPTNGRGMS